MEESQGQPPSEGDKEEASLQYTQGEKTGTIPACHVSVLLDSLRGAGLELNGVKIKLGWMTTDVRDAVRDPRFNTEGVVLASPPYSLLLEMPKAKLMLRCVSSLLVRRRPARGCQAARDARHHQRRSHPGQGLTGRLRSPSAAV